MDHAMVPILQSRCFDAIGYGSIPFLILSFCGVRWANRVANVLGFVVIFYVTIGQILWSLPYYGTHWSFDGPMLMADGVTCLDGCKADPITLAIRNYGSPAMALMIDVAAFLAVMAVWIGVSLTGKAAGEIISDNTESSGWNVG